MNENLLLQGRWLLPGRPVGACDGTRVIQQGIGHDEGMRDGMSGDGLSIDDFLPAVKGKLVRLDLTEAAQEELLRTSLVI